MTGPGSLIAVTGATSNSARQRYHGGLYDGGVQINPLCTVGTADR
jgi:hypothetical protein